MIVSRRSLCAATFAAAIIPLHAGCGGGSVVRVRGQVVENGQPFRPQDSTQYEISFLNEVAYLNLLESLTPDGRFDAKGSGRGGLPPGKYKIVFPANSAYSQDKTPLVIDVEQGRPLDLTIDLGKKTVTAN